MQVRSNITRCILRDVSVPAHLLAQHCPLGIVLGELALKGLQECEEMLGLNPSCTQQLERASFNAHRKLTFLCCSLPDNLIPCREAVDCLMGPACESEHLGHCCEATLFL